MAGANVISEFGGKLFGNIVTGSITAVVVLAILGVVGYTIWYFVWYKKKFDILVKVTSDRSGESATYFDWAAILNDSKNKTKFIRLLKSRVDLPVPPFNVLQSTNMGNYAEIHRTTEDTYYWLTHPVISKKWLVRVPTGKIFPFAKSRQMHLEQDIYWILKRKEQNKALIDPEGIWTKLIQMLPILIPAFIMLLLFWIFFDKMPEMFKTAIEFIREFRTQAAVEVATG